MSKLDAAFAHIFKAGDREINMLRHHKIGTIDPDDNSTVDVDALKQCIQFVKSNIIPFNSKQQELEVKAHLEKHAKAVGVCGETAGIWNETLEGAEKQIGAADGSPPGDANYINREPEKDTFDVPHPEIQPNTFEPSMDDGFKPKGIQAKDKDKDMSHGQGDKDMEGRLRDKSTSIHSPLLNGSLVKIKDELGIVTNNSLFDKETNEPVLSVFKVSDASTIVMSPDKIESSDILVKQGKLITANLEDPNNSILKLELRLLSSPEALMKFATPSAEEQNNRDRVILMACTQDLTTCGRDLVNRSIMDAMRGQVKARILNTEFFGSREFLDVTIGEDEDNIQFVLFTEVLRGPDKKVESVRIMNDAIPMDIMDDFVRFLDDLRRS